jgi:hypothetical protein
MTETFTKISPPKSRTLLFILVFSFTLFGGHTMAQVEGTMPFMKSLPQVTYYNPAFKPEYRFSFGLPGSSIFTQFTNNGFSYNDVVIRENGVLTADISKLYAALKDENYINTNFQADLLRLSFKVNARLYFTFNATAKVYTRIMLPKDIVGLLVNGTEPYVNSTAVLSPKVEALSYAEAGWGAAYTVSKKLTVGAKLKLLRGLASVTTQSATFNLSLSDIYAITATGDATIQTSGISGIHIDNIDSIGNYIEKIGDNWQDYLNNTGFAFDVGATYRIKDRFTLGLSLLDIGGITWKNDLNAYQLNSAQANYTFSGVDIEELLDGNNDYTESLADSLEENFKFTEGNIGSYYTALPAKAYLSGIYELKKTLTIGGLVSAEMFQGRFMTGFTTSLNKEFGKRIGASLSYTITNNSFNNVGAGLSFNFAPIQIYFVGDNILRAPLSLATDGNFNPYLNSLQHFNLRTGINFIFGREKVQEKQPYPKKHYRQ